MDDVDKEFLLSSSKLPLLLINAVMKTHLLNHHCYFHNKTMHKMMMCTMAAANAISEDNNTEGADHYNNSSSFFLSLYK